MMSMLSQILNIMYTESVREKEGGTYGVSAFGSLTKYPKRKRFCKSISIPILPNVPK